MKHTRLALALVITSLTTTPAFAATVTMVQFGSFETKAEAEKRIADITSKYAASVGKLPTSVREVKLPPDNLTVYRTQAGPLADRTAAQALCSQLSTAGDECYIVQTAMMTPQQAVATAAPSVTAPVAAATTTATAATTDMTSKLASLQEVSNRDPLNRAALSSVSATPTEAPQAAIAETKPSAEMTSALDKAVAEQNTSVPATVIEPAPAAAPRRSFWSRLNPFTPAPAAPVAAPVVAQALPTAAPVEAVQVETQAAPVVVAAAEPAPLAPPAAITEPSVALAPAALSNSQPAFDNSPVIMQAEPMRLPPPPAPLKAADREMLTAAKAAPMAPAATGEINTAPVAGTGTVQVEEAKRVPVTTASEITTAPVATATAEPEVTAVPVVAPKPVQPPVSLSPSATEGRKTVWAQVGPFADNDAALAFWVNYRQNHPDFPVVRVRVTTPYQLQQRGSTQSWLRVGPVTQIAFVKNLCASLAPKPNEKTPPATAALKCGVVTDLGLVSAPARSKGLLPETRYAR